MSRELESAKASRSSNAIRIKLFAQLRELAGWQERWHPLDLQSQVPHTPAAIWILLALPGAVSDVRIAINQQFAEPETPLKPGDELAFLPPITGG